jgi:hypothetical protein
MWYFGICYVAIWQGGTVFSEENTAYVFCATYTEYRSVKKVFIVKRHPNLI